MRAKKKPEGTFEDDLGNPVRDTLFQRHRVAVESAAYKSTAEFLKKLLAQDPTRLVRCLTKEEVHGLASYVAWAAVLENQLQEEKAREQVVELGLRNVFELDFFGVPETRVNVTEEGTKNV